MEMNEFSHEEMLATWPELGMDTEVEVVSLKPIIPQIINKESTEQKPLLCINCHWVSMTYDRDTEKAKCFVPENYAGINVVDGSKVYRFPRCIEQRDCLNTHPAACGINGKWWKEKVPSPIQDITIGGQHGTNLELVVGKKEPKYKVPSLKRLSKEDLDNL